MSGELWTAIAALLTLLGALLAWPKIRAQARKANAEAATIEWDLLRKEVERLTEVVKRQGRQIADLELRDSKRADRETELERENKALKQEVARLRTRVEGLEAILKVGPIPADMQKMLDELDRKTAKRGKR